MDTSPDWPHIAMQVFLSGTLVVCVLVFASILFRRDALVIVVVPLLASQTALASRRPRVVDTTTLTVDSNRVTTGRLGSNRGGKGCGRNTGDGNGGG